MASADFARRAAALALGAEESAIAATAVLTLVDWPARSGSAMGDARPALVALDADWLPPVVAHSTRFPGGPGSAASGR